MPQNVIVIAGPTASGKSQLAIDMALEYNGVVINCDASQVYKNIPILSAAPSPEDKQVVEHCLYEYIEPSVNSNVVSWLDDAQKTIKNVWSAGKLPIVAGGTGLYIDNLINGTTPIPEVSEKVRLEAMDIISQKGLLWLYEEVLKFDAKTAQRLNPNDTTRIRRAYEIFAQTGVSASEWFAKPMLQKLPEADFFVFKILPPKKVLDERCDMRLDMMMERGALDEVAALLVKNISPDLPAMRAKGIPEFADYLRGRSTLCQAVELAKIHTRQYAKRQITWFKNKLEANVVLEECYEKDELAKYACTNMENVIKNN